MNIGEWETVSGPHTFHFSDPRYNPDKSVMELDHESVLVAIPGGSGYRVEQAIPTEVSPSNLCFGGDAGRDLYLTDSDGCLRRIVWLLDEHLACPWTKR